MILHIIVSTLVVPPNVNPHNKCSWTRAYYLLQDIEHRNQRQATRVLCHDHMVAFGSCCQERRSCTPTVGCGSQRTATVQIDGCTTSMHSRRWTRRRRIIPQTTWDLRDKTPCTNSDLKAAESLYGELMAMTKDAEEVANDEAIARIQAIHDGHLETLAKDPTASLWIQYLDMIRILRKLIRAEQLGNWYLHLEAVSEMLPYMAASGH